MRKLAGAIAALGAANQASKISAAPANMVIAGAKSQMVSKYGIGAYVRPRMWYLSLLKLTLSQPLLIGIIALIAIISLFTYFFGWISLWYSLFYTKAVLCVLVNVILTIGNAIYFGIHALINLLIVAFQDIINGVVNFFLTPIANAINQIGVFLTLVPEGEYFVGPPGSGAPIIMAPIGGGNISAQPTHSFAYYVPTSIIGPGASAFGFIAVHPGAAIYATDAQGAIIYDEVFDNRGAKLLFPRIDEEATTEDWWTEILDRPPDLSYEFTFSLRTYSYTIWDWITSNAAEIAGKLIDFINPVNIIQTVTQTTPPFIWPIMPWLPWIW